METQQDTKVRMIALANLRAMCKRVSGVAHRFEVTKVTRSRVHVTYTNPDEYGRERPVTAVYPCYPSKWTDDAENPRVTLDALRHFGGTDSEDWQAFTALTDAPTLWRDPDRIEWRTHAEIMKKGNLVGDTNADNCVVCDLLVASRFKPEMTVQYTSFASSGWSDATVKKDNGDHVLLYVKLGTRSVRIVRVSRSQVRLPPADEHP